MATDIFDNELQELRKNRWERAFSGDEEADGEEVCNLKATIVIEHIMQARYVSAESLVEDLQSFFNLLSQ